MKEIFKIAWRNLWRNKRRTVITVSSIFFALFYSITMNSFQQGTYNLMIDNTVTQFTGHIQIQDVEYADNPVIDYSIPFTDSIKQILDNNEAVEYYFPRISTGALASSGEVSKISMVMGIDYNKEVDLIKLDEKVVEYYLDSLTVIDIAKNMDKKNSAIFIEYKEKIFNSKNDLSEDLVSAGIDTLKYIDEIYEKTELPKINFNNNEVLIGYKLAQYLNLNQGDSIILIGQGFRGATAVGKYKIAGFLNFPIDEFNRMAVYMPIQIAYNFVGAYEIDNNLDTTFFVNYIAINTIHSVSINSNEYKKFLNLKNEIEEELQNKMLTVVAWKSLNKKMIETIEVGKAKVFIFVFILYLVISFGILGTVMMLLEERKREFGVMMALGMKRRILSAIISLEMFFMGLLAIISAVIVSTPLLWLGSRHPYRLKGEMADSMSKMNMEPVFLLEPMGTFVFDQIIVVGAIVLMTIIFALFRINKLKVISSLRA